MKDAPKQVTGGLTRDDIWKIYERINIGDTVKYRATIGYDTRIEDSDKRYRHGTVTDKENFYCVVKDKMGIREAVLWIDIVFDKEACK